MRGKWKTAMYLIIETKSLGLKKLLHGGKASSHVP